MTFGAELWLAGLLAMLTMMLAVWLLSERVANAGIVDVAWAAGYSVLAVLYAVRGTGWEPRRLAWSGVVSLWSLRLAGHLLARVVAEHPVEDGRYRQLRRDWAERRRLKFLGFFLLQGVLDSALSLPFLAGCLNGASRASALEWAGLALWAVAILGEAGADAQLRRFKADPANRGRVCKEGLWRYSRHPNYFFEWLVWCAYALAASAAAWGWLTVYCPLLMLWFLFRVTGIPLTEQQALRSRGDAYRAYQATTSAFVPWFPRA